jgi:hypothetical protein
VDLIETHLFTDAAEARESGTLWIPFALTEPGVFDYTIGGKRVRVLKSPEDWHTDAFLRSASNAPITDEHPIEGAFSPDRPRQVVGMSDASPATVRESDGMVLQGGALFERNAINKVAKRQVVGVSAGFRTNLEHLTGVYTDSKGVKYDFDAVQRSPMLNHVALTRTPRVKNARILLDSAGRQFYGAGLEETVMNLTEALAQCDSAIGEVLKTTLSSKDARISELVQLSDSLRGELAAAKLQLKDAPTTDSIAEAVQARVALLARVKSLAPDVALDSLATLADTKDIYFQALKSLGMTVSDSESADFYRALLENAQILRKSQPSPRSLRATLMDQKANDSALSHAQKVREGELRRYGLGLKGN